MKAVLPVGIALALAAGAIPELVTAQPRLVPPDSVLSHVPDCADATWLDPCRIPVSNGDFNGPQNDGNFMHQDFEWFGSGVWHSIAAHMAPWTYHQEKPTEWPSLRSSKNALLEKPGDATWQWITLPPLRDQMRQTVSEPVAYAVQLRFRALGGPATLSLSVGAGRHGDITDQITATATAVPGDSRPTRLEASLPFDPAWAGKQLGILIGFNDGSGPVHLEDVVLLRHDGDGVPVPPGLDD